MRLKKLPIRKEYK